MHYLPTKKKNPDRILYDSTKSYRVDDAQGFQDI